MNSQANKPECPICLDDFQISGSHCIVSLPCGHIFGESCLRDSFQKLGNFCPLCRTPSLTKDIQHIQWDGTVPIDCEQSDLAIKKHEDLENKIKSKKELIGKLEMDLARSRGRYFTNQFSSRTKTLVKKEFVRRSVKNPSLLIETKISDGSRVSLTQKNVFITCKENDRFGVSFCSLSKLSKFSFIPLHERQIQGLEVSSFDQQTIATVSSDQNLIMTSVRSEQRIFQMNLPTPLWSCSWKDRSTLCVGGTQGKLFFVDGRGVIIYETILEKGPPIFSVSSLSSDLLLVSSPVTTKIFDLKAMKFLPEKYEGSQVTSCCRSNHYTQISRNSDNISYNLKFGKLSSNKTLSVIKTYKINKYESRAKTQIIDDGKNQFYTIPKEENNLFELFSSSSLDNNLVKDYDKIFLNFCHPSPVLDVSMCRSYDFYTGIVSSSMFQLYAFPF